MDHYQTALESWCGLWSRGNPLLAQLTISLTHCLWYCELRDRHPGLPILYQYVIFGMWSVLQPVEAMRRASW